MSALSLFVIVIIRQIHDKDTCTENTLEFILCHTYIRKEISR